MRSSVPERHLALLGLAAAAALLSGGCGPRPGRLDVAEVARKLGDRFTQVRHERIPPRKLRGYGELAADFALFEHEAGSQCSLLRIQCEDEAKAKIVHAKYVSDLHLLLPVRDETVSVAGLAFPVVSVPDQGVIAAFRTGARVTIAAATDAAELEAALAAVSGSFAGAELVPSSKVPMYLDAWDKHGFRFYYRPFEPPPPKPGDKRIEWRDYNVLGEFDFAKRNGEAGFIFWHKDEQCDFAEGLTNEQLWGYGARACGDRGLPVVVNSFIADSTWLVNRYRGQTQMKMPGYCGGLYTACDAYHAGKGHLAWSADAGLDAALSVLQKTWRRYAQLPTTIEYLEPHGELRHGEHDLLNEYGPQADKTFRAFLKETYGTLSAVSRRWHGRPDALASWDAVRVPELAHFLGYEAGALDLGGEWRIQYEGFKDGKGRPTHPAQEDWYLPACHDAAWPVVTAPQSDLAMFLPRRPAVWRRHFALPDGWRADKPKVWLYVFSLNRARQEPAPIYLNGRKVAEPVIGRIRNWTVAEVTDALREGENLLALRLPENFLGYRVYLTGQKPASYPYLGEQLNAQWADFVRWQAWVRQRAVRRGIEAIREADPDRPILCMSPDSFISGVEELCQDYGGRFHNTGYMAGWWAEPLPMMMRAADLPFSAEPGGPARDLPEFKRFLGNWLTEGVNAVHYFIHVGDVYWNDEIRTWFEENQAVVGAMGKMHVPKAEVAMLYGDDVENLTGWPWEAARSGYVPYQLNVMLHKEFHMDGVSPRDFARGFADGYRVIIDTNTCILDEKTVADIEGWVRRGGVFITLGQTGRHTPEKPDSWPISRLTGYRVTGITRHPDQRVMAFAPGQPVFQEPEWDEKQLRRVGLLMEKADKDCTDLLLWPGKEVAAGMRQVGKGKVVHVGCEHNHSPPMLRQLLAWLKVRQVPGYCDLDKVNSTHQVSNNGLYDLWIAWNWEQKANTSNLVFRDGFKPAYCVDLKTREKLTPTLDGGTAKIANLSFGPGDIRILAAPRQSIATAPLEWLALQRGWWRGTAKPSRPVPAYRARFALDLNEGWRMKPLDDVVGGMSPSRDPRRADTPPTSDHAALAAPTLDDRAWQQSRLGPWLVPESLPTHRAFFRKGFTVPARWSNGEIDLWMASWLHETVVGRLRVWLDGTELLASGREIAGRDLTAQLKPGTEHLLAVEVASEGQVAGCYGNTWLAYLPKPNATLDLAGAWTPSPDGLKWEQEVPLPGPWGNWAMARRRVRVAQPAGLTVMLWLETDTRCGIYGVMVNGRWVMRLHHEVGTRTYLNVTPWVKFGEENEFHIICRGGGEGAVKAVALRFFTAVE